MEFESLNITLSDSQSDSQDQNIDHIDEIDYSTYSKLDFQKLYRELIKSGSVQDQFNKLKKIKSFVENIEETERSAAFQKFLTEGGLPDDFDFRSDAFFNEFHKSFQLIKNQFTVYIKESSFQKEKNLVAKRDILEKLRELIEAPDSQYNFTKFKKIQDEWRESGSIPQESSQEIWSSYHALVNRFFDKRSIIGELRDLDRKKNLEQKKLICEKVENLASNPNMSQVLRELEELHDEFKHIGPVPKEVQEELWQRLKDATSKIHELKKNYFEELRKSHEINLEKKKGIILKLELLVDFNSDQINGWLSKTTELELLQEEWKKSGTIDKEQAAEINKIFWKSIKQFYHNKGLFFHQLEKEKKKNLDLKSKICEEVESLQESNQWYETTNMIIDLQRKWKTIGPVPFQAKDKIFARFKNSCDYFFNKKRDFELETDKTLSLNVEERKIFYTTLIDKIENQEKLEEIFTKWDSLGEIPAKYFYDDYKNFFDLLSKNAVSELKSLIDAKQIKHLKSNPEGQRSLKTFEQNTKNQIKELEDNIALWKNNIEFFSRSKNADKIKEEFNSKIEEGSVKLLDLKSKLKSILSY